MIITCPACGEMQNVAGDLGNGEEWAALECRACRAALRIDTGALGGDAITEAQFREMTHRAHGSAGK